MNDLLPNLLQLQRMAGIVTNPTNDTAFPSALSNAFYWGEILAYRAQDIISDDEWAGVAYPLFNAAIREKTNSAQLFFEEDNKNLRMGSLLVPGHTQAEELHGAADLMMGELEVGDAEFMPPAMEKLIVAMTDQLSERPEDRWYMILGFRFITMQVVETAVNAEMSKEAATAIAEEQQKLIIELKNEQRARKQLRKKFIKLMDINEVDDIQGWELVAIDHIREQVMESYVDHMIAYGAFEVDDEDEIGRVNTYLAQSMNRDLFDMDGVDPEDFLRIQGNAMLIIYDKAGEPQSIYVLGKDESLEGSLGVITIDEAPSRQAMIRLQEHIIDADELKEETDPFGVILVLKDSVLVNRDGKHIQMGSGRAVGLVMSNPDMQLSKYLL